LALFYANTSSDFAGEISHLGRGMLTNFRTCKSRSGFAAVHAVLSAAIYAVLFSAVVSTPANAKNTKSACAQILAQASAYEKTEEILIADREQVFLGKAGRRVATAYGTEVPIVHSFEKEGLFYEEIAEWFPHLRPEAKKILEAQSGRLGPWLRGLNINSADMPRQKWQTLNEAARLKYLLSLDDPFSVLSVQQRAQLFEDEFLTFDDILPGADTPDGVIVGDDLGSYEVRLKNGVIDRSQYLQQRQETENYLEGRVGHQHLFHAWPQEDAKRLAIAPQYIELLDATTWYLFWRQVKRNPNDAASIIGHPYLGVYNRAALDRLFKAVVNNDPQKFHNKFRMVGARAFPPSVDIPEQGSEFVPDWEMRSGNKGPKREFVEVMLEARLATGDYTGLRDYREKFFDPSLPIEQILAPHLNAKQMATLKTFEAIKPAMDYSPHKLAYNHVRNKILAPLFGWGARLDLPLKQELLKKEQTKYALALHDIAAKYLAKIAKRHKMSPTEVGELRADTLEEIEYAVYQFARRVRLDLDFERYLKPQPKVSFDITVKSTGPINVNLIPIGVEYSFRFPQELAPRSRAQADAYIAHFAHKLHEQFGSPSQVETTGGDSHGHGTIVKYKLKDDKNQLWRAEWDGISRYYVDGKVRNAWGGHVEVPSPKFTPQTLDDGISQLFTTARSLNLYPKRAAGGGHFNFDIEELMATLPAKQGARAMANFLAYFESQQELILFLWMHPLRSHAAYPIEYSKDFPRKLNSFSGDWLDLGRLLYESRYFNDNIGRKPKYAPINTTPLMTPIVPDEYKRKGLDIRNKEKGWFLSFGEDTGRVEARLFDAPVDEKMAALQIKYFRAVMNKTFNSSNIIPLTKKYTSADYDRWKNNPKDWVSDVTAHLRELGLNPAEFMGLIWDSFTQRHQYNVRQHEYEKVEKLLPAKPKPKVHGVPPKVGQVFWLSDYRRPLAA